MKPLTLLCYGLFLAGVVLFLVQLWFSPWGPATFTKLIVTDGCLFAIAFVWAFLVKENRDNDKIDKGHGLD